ncbi:unnamed protein product [Adineta ricciae]|uniref:Arrestin C-terminal-like domain-containing protein n=1 Tax=Adineta ricciae TaxID=249248 RepID=A0A815J9H5_ADIRI|nr:unnamed protein product [Adineta ricciae]CAF1558269.1 unnamed protein product [Adineta ricciae]
MGASESTDLPFYDTANTDATIVLEKPIQWYTPGETVSGKVSINIPWSKPISLDLMGEVGYTMTYSTDTNMVRVAYHRMPFFTVTKTDVNDGDKFELKLAEELPPSVNTEKNSYPYIRYLIQVNFSRTHKSRYWIIVCPRVVLNRANIRPVHFDAFNRKQMRLVCSIDQEWVLPGDQLQIEYKITNQNQELIKSMDGNISMKAIVRGIDYNETILNFVIDDVYDTKDDYVSGMTRISLPTQYFPPSFSYFNEKTRFRVHIEYLLSVDVHVEGVNTSLKTTVPLMIGFEPENITFNEVMSPNQHRLSVTSLHKKRHSRLRHFSRFSHS